MPRKPDRFERMVIQEGKRIKGLSAALLDPMFTIKLLRRQHRAYVRMVKNMPRVPYLVSDSLMRSAVIETLKQYAK